MAPFSSTKDFTCSRGCVKKIKEAIMDRFTLEGFQVKELVSPSGGFELSLTNGGMFKKVLGMQTALKVTATGTPTGVRIEAGIGIFGQQILPSIITAFVFWPVLIAQIWGLVQQYGMDEKVMKIAQETVERYGDCSEEEAQNTSIDYQFCPQCGKKNSIDAKFCNACGNKF